MVSPGAPVAPVEVGGKKIEEQGVQPEHRKPDKWLGQFERIGLGQRVLGEYQRHPGMTHEMAVAGVPGQVCQCFRVQGPFQTLLIGVECQMIRFRTAEIPIH